MARAKIKIVADGQKMEVTFPSEEAMHQLPIEHLLAKTMGRREAAAILNHLEPGQLFKMQANGTSQDPVVSAAIIVLYQERSDTPRS